MYNTGKLLAVITYVILLSYLGIIMWCCCKAVKGQGSILGYFKPLEEIVTLLAILLSAYVFFSPVSFIWPFLALSFKLH